MGTWPASILRVMGWWNVRDRIPSTSSRMTSRCDRGRAKVQRSFWTLRERYREGGRESERQPWRRVWRRRTLEISIIFRFVRINDETRPRSLDYPDWSGLEGSDISINPNACVWNINRRVDRVLSSGGGGGKGRRRVEEAILAGGIGWKVDSSRKWYFHVLLFRRRRDSERDDRGVSGTREMMKLRKDTCGKLRQIWIRPGVDPLILILTL